jgi:prepilin-type N-terminal cleavage/methylation domain-containing protein
VKTRAFTLVELLVTIAIVAVLLALVLPAMSAVRMRGRASHVLAELQGTAQATTVYVHTYRDTFPFAGVAGEPFKPIVVNGVASTQQYLYAHAAFVPNLVRPFLDRQLVLSFLGTDMTSEQTAALANAPSPIARFWLTQTTATDPSFWVLGGPANFSLARATRDNEVRFPSQKVMYHSLHIDPTTGQRAVLQHRFKGVGWAMMDGSARTLPRAEDMTPSFARPWGLVPLRGLATEHGLHGVDAR